MPKTPQDEHLQNDLLIDHEFSDLISPLSAEEYELLENSLIEDGCREPIITWGRIIVDGHNRYKICTKWGIEYQCVSKDFVDRDEVIAWICLNQLGRRNITEETRKYLIGKRFDAEKAISRRLHGSTEVGEQVHNGRKRDGSEILRPQRKNPTAERLGNEYHISHSTVEKYALYSRAVDAIGHKSPEIKPMILQGRYKISHGNVALISKMDSVSIQQIEKRLRSSEIIGQSRESFVPLSVSRGEIGGYVQQKGEMVLRTGIKEMPKYDPDADVNGLILTIPAWISSINRTKEKADLTIISQSARKNLTITLRTLMESIIAILKMIMEQ